MSILTGSRVIFVLGWADLGGAERNALGLASHLRSAHAAEVEVLALTARDGSARRLWLEHGVSWHGADVSWSGGRARKARVLGAVGRRLRARRPDVLVPYCTRPNVLCGLVWRTTGASLAVWNQQDVNPSRVFGSATIRRALDWTPLAFANSGTARDFLVSEWGARPERVHVLHDVEPVVARGAGPAWRRRLGIGDDAGVALMSAHLHAFKDHATLLRAWRIALDRIADSPAPALVLAGRPAGEEAELKALAFDLDLGGSVIFAGEVADVGGLLDACDIGVLSSRRESRPRAVLEYMAGGLPVAGTDIPGIVELVGDEGARFLAPPGDAERLAAVLLELITSPELRRAAGSANERLARKRAVASSGPEQAAALVADALERAKRH